MECSGGFPITVSLALAYFIIWLHFAKNIQDRQEKPGEETRYREQRCELCGDGWPRATALPPSRRAAPLPAGGMICGEGSRVTHVSEPCPGQTEGGQEERRESRMAVSQLLFRLAWGRHGWTEACGADGPTRSQRPPLPRPASWASIVNTGARPFKRRQEEVCFSVGSSSHGLTRVSFATTHRRDD